MLADPSTGKMDVGNHVHTCNANIHESYWPTGHGMSIEHTKTSTADALLIMSCMQVTDFIMQSIYLLYVLLGK